MAYENLTLLFTVGQILFFLLGLLFILKNRKFERTDMETAINAIVFSLFLLLVTALISALDTIVAAVSLDTAAPLAVYTGYLTGISTLGIFPVAAAALLVAILIVKDRLTPVKSSASKTAKKERETQPAEKATLTQQQQTPKRT